MLSCGRSADPPQARIIHRDLKISTASVSLQRWRQSSAAAYSFPPQDGFFCRILDYSAANLEDPPQIGFLHRNSKFFTATEKFLPRFNVFCCN
jgi:hypothetical protein